MDRDKMYGFLWDLLNLISEYNTEIIGVNYQRDLSTPIYIELTGIGNQKYELMLRKRINYETV